MRVVVLHNAVPADAPLEDQDTLVQVEAVAAALGRLGHEPVVLPCTLDLGATQAELARQRPDAVFNLVESLAGVDSLMYVPLAILDAFGVPYTGSGTEAMFLTTHKLLAKERMQYAGLPTPAWIDDRVEKGGQSPTNLRSVPAGTAQRVLRTNGDCPPFSTREASSCPSCSSWILKGVWEHGSRDLDDEAVLSGLTATEVWERLQQRAVRSGRPSFAEQFIEGREFAVTVLAAPRGPEVLLPAEIDFSSFPAGKPRIVGYRAKWRDDCYEYNHTPRRFDFGPSDEPLLLRLKSLAADCWALFGLRGWARVDFRVDQAGQPWVLEVNANPCLSPDAGFAAALQRASIPYDTAIERILNDRADNVSQTD
jgi:D-alanine-D-alanine ligase